MEKSIYTILTFLLLTQLVNYKVFGQIKKGDLLVSSGMTIVNFSEGPRRANSTYTSPISIMKQISPNIGGGINTELDTYSTWYRRYKSYSADLFIRVYPLEKVKFFPFLQLSSGLGKNKTDSYYINGEETYRNSFFRITPSFGTQLLVTKNLGFEIDIQHQTEIGFKKEMLYNYLPVSELKLDLKAFYRFSKK